MNLLLRSTSNLPAEQPSVSETPAKMHYMSKPAATLSLGEDPFSQYSIDDDFNVEADDDQNAKNDYFINSEVSEEEGWITIPYKDLPDDWSDAPDIHSLRSLDRPFVFPGEQVHILACLSTYEKDTEIITPFKVAAVMSRRQSPKKESLSSGEGDMSPGIVEDQNGENHSSEESDLQKEESESESFLRKEDHKRRTEILLERFENSHFYVRITESGEPLWSKKVPSEEYSEFSDHFKDIKSTGNYDAIVSVGLATHFVKCGSLSNGDIVVLLQVNIGVDFLRDPMIEILQFEKYEDKRLSPENTEGGANPNQDPCGELLKWLLPLETIAPPPSRALPPRLSPSLGVGSASQKPASSSSSSGSQLFSFGNLRSYSMPSMPSMPQNTAQPPTKTSSSRIKYDPVELDQFSYNKFSKNKKTASKELLSFRGVSLERERFSAQCGLEGLYIPGRRWRRKLEIIQPVEIQSFTAYCDTDDLLCVQIKNISPADRPDIVVYIDAITIVFEEASEGGPPLSLPIAGTEAGNECSLPNLALRRGEEHSFILKPATSMLKNLKPYGERITHLSHLPSGNAASGSNADKYAIMVSCRCNYTESRLFFKQPTSWRPYIPRDLMISVASETAAQSPSVRNVSPLPVQVLNLQVSNLTFEDLTLTVLAPNMITSPPSILPLNSSPSLPMTPLYEFSESPGRGCEGKNGNFGAQSVSLDHKASRTIDPVLSSTGVSGTHLWLQNRVPLGCVPSRTTTTIKLELLPLTGGIMTLNTLQINVLEKGITYIPEHLLKINATSSISSVIS